MSQASVRRWFDAGLLPGHRVGRRGERRFREQDLVAFLNRGSAAAPAATTVMLAGVASAVPLHVATLFGSEQGATRLTAPFLADGVRLRQPCFLVATGATLERYRKAMSLEGIEVLRINRGTASDAVAQWEEAYTRVLANGPALIRHVGDMADVRDMFKSEDEMLRFEEAFEVMCRRYPVAVICQYDARQFDGVALLRALKAHPDLFGLRLGSFLN